MDMIETKALEFAYPAEEGEKPVLALRGVDTASEKGSFVVVLGHNGSGKSTLAKHMNAVLLPTGGNVWVEGMDTADPALLLEIRRRIGMVFQEPEHQFAASTVRDEVAIGPKSMGKTDEEAYSIADRQLERLNLSRFAKANPFTLSGGEKRRLSVASMLAAAPKVLVMDEPTFGQDFTTWASMVQLIAGARDQGCAVIMITHDEPLIEALGARCILVREGE